MAASRGRNRPVLVMIPRVSNSPRVCGAADNHQKPEIAGNRRNIERGRQAEIAISLNLMARIGSSGLPHNAGITARDTIMDDVAHA